jgi:putative transposase
MPLHRRVARLPPQNYFGRQAYFVTICCDRRAPSLRDPATAQSVLALLLQCAATHSFLLHAYCVMPDHSHVLTEGLHDRSDLHEFIRVLKQRSAFAFRKSHSRRLWEMSYHDHILRPSDGIEDVACYIWWNPVRKKLCAHPQEFPFSGSQTIDWIKRSAAVPSWTPPWKTRIAVGAL